MKSPGSGQPDPLHSSARALGSPVRYRVFRLVAGAGRPVSVVELAEATGLTPNAVRAHLAKLVEANLVLERIERRTTRGRPRTLYIEAPGQSDRWAETPPYQDLALLLAEVVARGETPREVGRRAGRRLADRPAIVTGNDASNGFNELVAQLAAQGFAPRVASGGDPAALEQALIGRPTSPAGRAPRRAGADGPVSTIALSHCPYAEAARFNPEVVCELHLGLLEGMAETLADAEGASDTDRLEVRALEPRPAQTAGCLVRVARPGNGWDTAGDDRSAEADPPTVSTGGDQR